MELSKCSKIHSPSLAFTLCFILVFLIMSSRMTSLELTFSLIKKERSILIKAEISQGGIWKNPRVCTDTETLIQVLWLASDHLGFPSAVYFNLHIFFFSSFTNNPIEMSSETLPQGGSILQKVSEKNDKAEGSLQGSVCRYFSFVSRHLNTAALWKAAELRHEAVIPQLFLKSFCSLLFGAENWSKEEERDSTERNLAHGPQFYLDLQLRISAHWRRVTW